MKFLGWVYWAVYQLASVLFLLVGLIPLLLLALSGAWHEHESKLGPFAGRKVLAWRGGWLTSPWNNDEDGVTGTAEYRAKHAWRPLWLQAYMWSAFRNFSNGFRSLPGAFFIVDSEHLTIRDTKHGYVATQGWRQCVRYRNFHFGWLIKHDAATGWYAWPVIGPA